MGYSQATRRDVEMFQRKWSSQSHITSVAQLNRKRKNCANLFSSSLMPLSFQICECNTLLLHIQHSVVDIEIIVQVQRTLVLQEYLSTL